jgi:uncharacterized protein with FMN-binding domain
MFPRRGAIALVTTAIALVLLLNFKTPDQQSASSGIASTVATSGASSAGQASSASQSSTASGSSGAAASPSGAVASPSAAAKANASSGTETLTGPVVQSRYGNTQVQVTITNGQITSVTALQLPSGGRSGQISQYVQPILSSEALTAQSANIDIVSGATYTSEAYAQSLQAALDQAAVSATPAG